MNYLGLHNKPKAEVQPERMRTGPKEEKEEEEHFGIRYKSVGDYGNIALVCPFLSHVTICARPFNLFELAQSSCCLRWSVRSYWCRNSCE